MKMKNFTALFALMIIGLLVITGCQGLFDPPSKPAASGNGTLLVSINGADGRTILPSAGIDKYALKLSVLDGSTYEDYDGEYPAELQGSAGLEVAPNTYKVEIKAYIGDVVVASGEASAIEIAAGGVGVATIAMVATTEGTGTFSWDLSDIDDALDVKGVAIEIYQYTYDDDEEEWVLGTDDLLAEEEDIGLTGEFDLDAGIYNVKFTLLDDSDDEIAAWWEILYIYDNLISAYDPSAVDLYDIIPTVPYVVPVAGKGYFYVDLNDWKTIGHNSINAVRPVALTATDKITVDFTQNNQRVNFGLSGNQVALLSASTEFKTTIIGEVTSGDSSFRYHIGDATTGSDWNVSNGSGEKPFADFLDATTGTTTQTIDSGRLAKIKHLILQHRSGNADTIVIKSIRIDYTLATDGVFELDLEAAEVATTGVTAWNILDSAVDFDVEDGVLTAEFTAQYQRLNFVLPAIVDLFDEDGDLFDEGNAEFEGWDEVQTVFVTITGSATPDAKFRYHIGDQTTSSNWNATGGAGDTAFSNLASTWALSVANPERDLKALMLNYYDTPTSVEVEISKIEIAYKLKPVWNPPPAATEDLVVVTSASPVVVSVTPAAAYTGSIDLPLAITWPATLKPGSYSSFTLELEVEVGGEVVSGEDLQWWFTAGPAGSYWTGRIATGDFANGRSANGNSWTEEELVLNEQKAENIVGICAQNKTAQVSKVTVTSFILHP